MTAKRQCFLLGVLAVVAGCSSSGSDVSRADLICVVGTQKQAVADLMQEWYLFNDEVQQQQSYATLDLSQFATPEELLESLLYQPDRFDRNFSFITTPQVDQQFFANGQFVGFGFGSKFADSPMNTDLRLTQIIAGSPAEAAGLARGHQILTVNGRTIAEIEQAEGLSAALGPSDVGVMLSLRVRRPDSSEFDVDITKALVTLDPVPQATTFTAGTTTVGYLDFRTFVSTADAELRQAFAQFQAAGVTALVVDLRYNGGGLVSTAQLLTNLIGGSIADGQEQARTLYNSAKSALNQTTVFQTQANSLTLLNQVVFITTGSSASASELVINALEPHSVVGLVGAPTFGKPVGQGALSYCAGQYLLRAVTFETVNSLGAGQFYDGLPVDCPASDELERDIGDPLEASLASALGLVENGSCPVSAAPSKPAAYADLTDPPLSPSAGAGQRYAGLY